jgi:hypothetical protein
LRLSFLEIILSGLRTLKILKTLIAERSPLPTLIETHDTITVSISKMFQPYFKYDSFPLNKNPTAIALRRASAVKIEVIIMSKIFKI